MIAPSAQMVEQARGQLNDVAYRQAHSWLWPDQIQELRAAVPEIDTLSPAQGYELGLQAARVFLAGNPAAIQAKITF